MKGSAPSTLEKSTGCDRIYVYRVRSSMDICARGSWNIYFRFTRGAGEAKALSPKLLIVFPCNFYKSLYDGSLSKSVRGKYRIETIFSFEILIKDIVLKIPKL